MACVHKLEVIMLNNVPRFHFIPLYPPLRYRVVICFCQARPWIPFPPAVVAQGTFGPFRCADGVFVTITNCHLNPSGIRTSNRKMCATPPEKKGFCSQSKWWQNRSSCAFAICGTQWLHSSHPFPSFRGCVSEEKEGFFPPNLLEPSTGKRLRVRPRYNVVKICRTMWKGALARETLPPTASRGGDTKLLRREKEKSKKDTTKKDANLKVPESSSGHCGPSANDDHPSRVMMIPDRKAKFHQPCARQNVSQHDTMAISIGTGRIAAHQATPDGH